MERWGFDAMGQIFVLLAGRASFDVFRDPRSCAGPKVFPIYFPDRLVSSGVSTEWAIVPRVHELAFQALVWGNDESVSLDVSPERGVWVVHSFDGESAFPFFHKGAMSVLDDGDGVF